MEFFRRNQKIYHGNHCVYFYRLVCRIDDAPFANEIGGKVRGNKFISAIFVIFAVGNNSYFKHDSGLFRPAALSCRN